MSHKDEIRIGVVGLGLGRWHVDSFSKVPGCRVTAVCDIAADRLTAIADEFTIEHRFTDYADLCASDAVDAVSVCVPNSLHAEVAVAAFTQGKHCIVEKPLADTVEHAEAIERAHREAGTIGMTAMKLRFGKEAAYIRREVDEGTLGHVYYGWSTYLRGLDGVPMRPTFTRKSVSGGGAIIDNGVHLLDLTWYLMGCPDPVSVTGMTDLSYAPIGAANQNRVAEAGGKDVFDVETFGCGMIRFANGAAAMLDNGWSTFVAEPTFSVRVLGTEGGATLLPFTFVREHDGAAVSVAPDPATLPEETQFAHFIRCIREGNEPLSTIEQGVRMVRMLDALYESDRTAKSVAVGNG